MGELRIVVEAEEREPSSARNHPAGKRDTTGRLHYRAPTCFLSPRRGLSLCLPLSARTFLRCPNSDPPIVYTNLPLLLSFLLFHRAVTLSFVYLSPNRPICSLRVLAENEIPRARERPIEGKFKRVLFGEMICRIFKIDLCESSGRFSL